ncbi:MAG: hypothetical protein J6L02_01335 [Bacteroidales bacterium]|nr:hypothetical protein [Bacteroidales bacterium]
MSDAEGQEKRITVIIIPLGFLPLPLAKQRGEFSIIKFIILKIGLQKIDVNCNPILEIDSIVLL